MTRGAPVQQLAVASSVLVVPLAITMLLISSFPIVAFAMALSEVDFDAY